jgi:hypothetical protein
MASSLSCFFDKFAVFDAQAFVTGQGKAEFRREGVKIYSCSEQKRGPKFTGLDACGSCLSDEISEYF